MVTRLASLSWINTYLLYSYLSGVARRYDLKDTSKLYIADLLIVTAMGLPGGSRQDVYARFLRHFSIFGINTFSDESTTKIFATLLFIGLKVTTIYREIHIYFNNVYKQIRILTQTTNSRTQHKIVLNLISVISRITHKTYYHIKYCCGFFPMY